jgi:general secretion pathway protein A
MYKEFFNLNSKVFCRHSNGGSTFMSTQQTQLRSRIAAALSSKDTIITVTGPAGCGKSMLVYSAIEALQITPVIAKIARMQLGHGDVLELLLSELGAIQQPIGTIQRFAEFKRLANDIQDKGSHLLIVVEDAQRLGMDALGELESLTSAGDCNASIVLMGPPELSEILSKPEHARIKHRTRLHVAVEAFSASETRDYLAYRINAGSGNLENVFDSSAVDLVHRYSGGIRRVIDTLCEAALNAATAANTKPVSSNLISQTARRELGLDLDSIPAVQPARFRQDPEVIQPPSNCLAPELPKPQQSLANSDAEKPDAEQPDEIPQLIQDTLPSVEALPEPVIEDAAEEINPPPEIDRTAHTQPIPTTTAMIEPVAPEPLKWAKVDEKAIKQLDDALRPDTQLLRTLDAPPAMVEDLAPVPLGLQGEMNNAPSPSPESAAPVAPASPAVPVAAAAPAALAVPADNIESSSETTETNIPTLSDSMRFTAPKPAQGVTPDPGDTQTIRRPNFAVPADEQGTAKSGEMEDLRRPNIEALESAMAIARKGPVDLETNANSVAKDKPAAADEAEMSGKAVPPTTAAKTVVPEPPAPAANLATADDLKLSVTSSFPEITLDTSLEKRKNDAEAKLREQNPISTPDELDPETNEEGPAEEVSAANDASNKEVDKQTEAERAKINKLASDLGNAKSLEEIDDFAAETLFGAEFNEAAAAVTAMAAANSAGELELELEDSPEDSAEDKPDEAVVAAGKAETPGETPGNIDSKSGELPRQKDSPPAVPRKPDVDSSSVRRFALVRALNGAAAGTPAPTAPKAATIPAAPASTPTPPSPGKETGNAEDQNSQLVSIENQFGADMSSTLKALSVAKPVNRADPDDDDDDDEKKKTPFLSRFKRS